MVIQLRELKYAYPKSPDRVVLDIPDWSLAAQEHVFIHGPSGGGKSTLLNIISGMLAPAAGEVSVLNQRLDQMSSRQRDRFRANHIGYVFQQFNLIPYLNALDNIQLATRFAGNKPSPALRSEMEQLLSTLNIAAEEWHKPTASLSIGQQQRIAIARAMINQPELLIADEPTSSLDQANRDNFMSVILPLLEQSNTTLVLVSHDMTLAQYFDRQDALSTINRGGNG